LFRDVQVDDHEDPSPISNREQSVSGSPLTPKSKPTAPNPPPSTGKRVRLTATGKVHATARPITADLDEIDQCIYRMKSEGKSNSEVVPELQKLGCNYDQKTVGTRFIRIKAVVAKNKDMINGRVWTAAEVSLVLPLDVSPIYADGFSG
jgi:hypothetical protein